MTDYPTYVTQLQTMVATDSSDTNFQTILPAIINYAEMRIYRELDLISTITRDTGVVLSPGTQSVALPQTFVIVQGINLLTPANSPVLSAARQFLTPASKEVIYGLWNDPTVTGPPTLFAMVDQWTALLGPSPDASYTIETYGTIRPNPLSATNTTTFLTLYLYDLFMAASMIFVSGYMRNFSSAGNDPNMPVNWESQYQALKASANVEELRKKSWSDAWTTLSPTPLAQPPRG